MKEICLNTGKILKRSLIISLLTFLIFLTQTVSPANSQSPQSSFRLGFVSDAESIASSHGAADSIWLANTKEKDRIDRKAIAILGYGSFGAININGRDIELKLIKDNLPDRNFKVGRGGYQIWKGKKTTVRLDYVFTRLCPQNQEGCSVYYYKGILNIKYNGKRRKVNIRGFGGS
jgi:hypothetical protein